MPGKIYITDGYISLAEYDKSIDDTDCFNCWRDADTQKGYNSKCSQTFEEYRNRPIRSRFIATIIRCSDNARIGSIFVSPADMPPDLAFMIYAPYRNQGYGKAAFALGVKYCFDVLKLDRIYAGCYEDNLASMKILNACGFVPHPEGNQSEKHYLTGEHIIQYDFVLYNRA